MDESLSHQRRIPAHAVGVGDFTNKLGKTLAKLGVEVSIITSTKARMQKICLASGILYRYSTVLEEKTQVR